MAAGRGRRGGPTYKQLKSGKLYCKLTGEIVKNSKRHRWLYLRAIYPRQVEKKVEVTPRKKQSNVILEAEYLTWDIAGYKVRCPYCFSTNRGVYEAFQISCKFCGRVFSFQVIKNLW